MPSSSSTTVDFETIREKLRTNSAYLADTAALEDLTWYKTQYFSRVVRKEAVLEYDEELKDYALDPAASLQPSPPPAAVLSAVVRLSNQGFFLSACGGWHPGRKATIRFSKIRPAACAEDPRVPELAGDFESARGNLTQLIERDLDKTAGLHQCEGAIAWSKPHIFKIGCRVFEEKLSAAPLESQASAGGEDEDDGADDEPEFRIENWPLQCLEAQPFLDEIKDTHIAIPIPAYNIAGKRIHPARYSTELRGAIVRLEFVLNHFCINHKHNFTADIERIRVLVPPPPFDTPTPRRKRTAKHDAFDFEEDDDVLPSTPTKKRTKANPATQ